MTAIEGIGRSPGTRLPGRATGLSSSGFVLPSGSAAAGPATSSAPAPAASLTAMLTLQELGGMTVEDRDARRHGQDVLVLLAELQRDLLAGPNDGTALARLAELATEFPRATDSRLAALVSAILVRARVELARRQL